MAFEQNPYAIKVTFVAGEDFSGLTGWSKQFHFVKLDDTLVGTTPVVVDIDSSITDRPIGILQNQPKLGGEAEVTISGVVKVVAGGTITAGDPIGAGEYGKAVAVASDSDALYVVGTAITSGTNGDLITVVINCSVPFNVDGARGPQGPQGFQGVHG